MEYLPYSEMGKSSSNDDYSAKKRFLFGFYPNIWTVLLRWTEADEHSPQRREHRDGKSRAPYQEVRRRHDIFPDTQQDVLGEHSNAPDVGKKKYFPLATIIFLPNFVPGKHRMAHMDPSFQYKKSKYEERDKIRKKRNHRRTL